MCYLAPNEDRLHRRLHVVVDAAPAGPLEQRERPVVGVKHNLLRLARIGPDEQHPAVAKPDMRRLHNHRDPAVTLAVVLTPLSRTLLSGKRSRASCELCSMK